MKAVHFLVASVFLALASSLASASDPSPLQDFCVAINDTKNGGKFFLCVYKSYKFMNDTLYIIYDWVILYIFFFIFFFVQCL